MPNKKKLHPRTSYIIFRVTKEERALIEKMARELGKKTPQYIRYCLHLDETTT